MKITGAEWNLFEAEGCPASYVWSDDLILDDDRALYCKDGSLSISDSDTFVVPDSWSMYDEDAGVRSDSFSVRAMIRKWRASRDYAIVAVTVKKSELTRFRDILEQNEWKGKS
jgi:hypothetical protein